MTHLRSAARVDTKLVTRQTGLSGLGIASERPRLVASTILPSCGFVGPWRPLVREEQFLQGAEEFEQAREGHGCLSSHRVDEPFDPAVGRPVDV